jgi:hypothetical protein
MSKEQGEELFSALNVLIDAITSLHLRDLKAEAKGDRGGSSTGAATASLKGKDKVAEPDWEDIPYNPLPITPLSSKPRFTQVVESSSEAMSPPRPSLGAATLTASTLRPPGDAGRGRGGIGGRGLGESPRDPSPSPSRSPTPSEGHSDDNGDGGGVGGGRPGAGGAQQGGPPLAYNTAAQFIAMWNNCATDVARQNLEQQAIARSSVAEVQMAAMVKANVRHQPTIGTLTGQVRAAQAAATAVNQAAVNAHAVATAAENADRFRPAAPPKYRNKKKDAEMKQWLPIIEDYLRTAPDADYIRLASSYLEGGPRSL